MIPASFAYARAESVSHALDLLGQDSDAKVLAGGHSLVPLLKLRFAQPSLLVDIGRLPGLAGERLDGDEVVIGALTRHCRLVESDTLRRACPLIAETAAQVGDPQVRHRGTIGGSAAHADPASDLPVALLAAGARFVITGAEGERTVPADEFFLGFLESAVRPDELLTEIRVPQATARRATYLKFTRRAQDWATVGVAVVASVNHDRVDDVAIALTNMGSTPVRAQAAERLLTGGPVDAAAITAAAAVAADRTSPPSDSNGSADYRRHLCRILVERALQRTLTREGP